MGVRRAETFAFSWVHLHIAYQCVSVSTFYLHMSVLLFHLVLLSHLVALILVCYFSFLQ